MATNSQSTSTTTTSIPTSAQTQLRTYVERIERLEEEKSVLSEDVKGIFAEAKANGYDTKAMKRVIAIRKLDPQIAKEFDDMVDLYKHALGMI